MRDQVAAPFHPARCLPPAASLIMAVVSGMVCLTGCERRLDTAYATVRGTSINGVSAFVQLLRDTGHATTAQQQLPRRIRPEYRTIVIFDDSFTHLDTTAGEVLLGTLAEDTGRTLLLVLRDSDATIGYLRDILQRDDLPADRRGVAESLLASAEHSLSSATAEPREETFPFPDGLVPVVRPAVSETMLVQMLDAGEEGEPIAADWPLRRRLDDPASGQPLWQTGDEPLLVRQKLGETEFLVMASAAPLLNGGLVDRGNRLLAEHLARLLPTDGKLLLAGSSRVTSASGRSDSESVEEDEPSPWRLLLVQPLPWITAQILLAMGLFCWHTAPIFGRARRGSAAEAQDFGHHIDALAHLLERAGAPGTAFSWRRLQDWRNLSPRNLQQRRCRRRPRTDHPSESSR